MHREVVLIPSLNFVVPTGTEAEKELKELAEFAKNNPWDRRIEGGWGPMGKYTKSVKIPCPDGHEHTLHVIFTYTLGDVMRGQKVMGKIVIRQATISMDDKKAYPAADQVVTVATHLGFQGEFQRWHIVSHPAIKNGVAIAQAVDEAGRDVPIEMIF